VTDYSAANFKDVLT